MNESEGKTLPGIRLLTTKEGMMKKELDHYPCVLKQYDWEPNIYRIPKYLPPNYFYNDKGKCETWRN